MLDRLSPGRSTADREAAEASTTEMMMSDFDAPNKFEVTGREISEANVTRRELRAHDKEQERRDAFKQQPVPSSAGDADELAFRGVGAHGTAIADRRKTVSPEGLEKLQKHLTDDEGVLEHKETAPPPRDDSSEDMSKRAKKIDRKSRKAEQQKEKEKIQDALEIIKLEYDQQKRRLEKARSKAVDKKQFHSSKDKKQKYKGVVAELDEDLIKLESNYRANRRKTKKKLHTIKEGTGSPDDDDDSSSSDSDSTPSTAVKKKKKKSKRSSRDDTSSSSSGDDSTISSDSSEETTKKKLKPMKFQALPAYAKQSLMVRQAWLVEVTKKGSNPPYGFIKHDYDSLMDVLHEMGVHQFVVGEKKEVIKEVIGALLEPGKNQIDSVIKRKMGPKARKKKFESVCTQLADQFCRDDEEESSKGTIQEGQWMWKQLEEIKMSTPRDFKERTPKGYYNAMKAIMQQKGNTTFDAKDVRRQVQIYVEGLEPQVKELMEERMMNMKDKAREKVYSDLKEVASQAYSAYNAFQANYRKSDGTDGDYWKDWWTGRNDYHSKFQGRLVFVQPKKLRPPPPPGRAYRSEIEADDFVHKYYKESKFSQEDDIAKRKRLYPHATHREADVVHGTGPFLCIRCGHYHVPRAKKGGCSCEDYESRSGQVKDERRARMAKEHLDAYKKKAAEATAAATEAAAAAEAKVTQPSEDDLKDINEKWDGKEAVTNMTCAIDQSGWNKRKCDKSTYVRMRKRRCVDEHLIDKRMNLLQRKELSTKRKRQETQSFFLRGVSGVDKMDRIDKRMTIPPPTKRINDVNKNTSGWGMAEGNGWGPPSQGTGWGKRSQESDWDKPNQESGWNKSSQETGRSSKPRIVTKTGNYERDDNVVAFSHITMAEAEMFNTILDEEEEDAVKPVCRSHFKVALTWIVVAFVNLAAKPWMQTGLWDSCCNRAFIDLELFRKLHKAGLIVSVRIYDKIRKCRGSCNGAGNVLGWCILQMSFGEHCFKYCFEIVSDLGVPYMIGLRFMELFQTVTDHGKQRIDIRLASISYLEKPKGDALPKATMGYPKDGSMPSATVPLCNLYLSEKAASESMECVNGVITLKTKKRKLKINEVAMEPNVLEHQLECFALSTSSLRGLDQI